MMVLNDLSRAFTTVSREVLLEKLHYYGVPDILYKFLKLYIEDRKQTVDSNGTMSEISCGA